MFLSWDAAAAADVALFSAHKGVDNARGYSPLLPYDRAEAFMRQYAHQLPAIRTYEARFSRFKDAIPCEEDNVYDDDIIWLGEREEREETSACKL